MHVKGIVAEDFTNPDSIRTVAVSVLVPVEAGKATRRTGLGRVSVVQENVVSEAPKSGTTDTFEVSMEVTDSENVR